MPPQRPDDALREAYEAAGSPALADFHEFIDQAEFELAADVLIEFGDDHEPMPEAFWRSLEASFRAMVTEGPGSIARDARAKLCQLRVYEAKYGFVEGRLTLVPLADGGKSQPIMTGYRPDWDIGSRNASDGIELNGAAITLEDAASIAPGGNGLVRLHPLLPEAWSTVEPAMVIAMHEGARVVGHAVVVRISLR